MRPPVVAGVGAALCAGGAAVVARFSGRTTTGCAAVGISANGKPETSFFPHCFEPGVAMVGGLVLLIGGAVLLVVGLTAMVRSWSQRERSLGPDVLPARPERATGGRSTEASGGRALSPASTALPPGTTGSGAGPAEHPGPLALSPPPGWYAVPPDNEPMWWDGHAWGTAPTLPPVPAPAGEGR